MSVDERRGAIGTVVDNVVINVSGRTRIFQAASVVVNWTSLTDEQEAAEDAPW